MNRLCIKRAEEKNVFQTNALRANASRMSLTKFSFCFSFYFASNPAIRSKLFASLKGFPLLSGVFLDSAVIYQLTEQLKIVYLKTIIQ